MTKSHYRALVILSLVLSVTGGLIDFIVPSLIPASLLAAQEEYDASVSSMRITVSLSIAVLALVLSLVATFGLYQFRRWAPQLALASTVLSLLVLPMFGAIAQSGWSMLLLSAASSLWGAALVLCFVAPYREWFDEDASNASVDR